MSANMDGYDFSGRRLREINFAKSSLKSARFEKKPD